MCDIRFWLLLGGVVGICVALTWILLRLAFRMRNCCCTTVGPCVCSRLNGRRQTGAESKYQICFEFENILKKNILQNSDEVFSLASREEPDFFSEYFLKPNILFGFLLLLSNLLFPHSFVVLAYQFLQPGQLHFKTFSNLSRL